MSGREVGVEKRRESGDGLGWCLYGEKVRSQDILGFCEIIF